MSTPNIIPSIFRAVDQLTAPVMRMGAALMKFGMAGKFTDANMARLGRSLDDISNKAFALAGSASAIGLGLIIPLGIAAKAAMNFEKEMGDVGTLVNTSLEDMGQMGQDVLDMAGKIPKPINDITKSLYQVRSAGFEAGKGVNQAFGILQSAGMLATAGLSTMEEATKAVTSAMVVFKDENLSSTQIANSFFKTIQGGKTKMNELNVAFGRNAGIVAAAGVSLAEFNAMTAALTNTGMQAAQAQTGIAGAITALIRPSSDLASVYQSLGYSGPNAFKEIVKASGGLVNAMNKIDETGTKMGIGFSQDFREKRAMLAELLLTGTLNASYMKLLNDQMNGQNTITAKFNEQNDKAAARAQRFRNNIEKLSISIGNLLLPAINSFMDALTPIINAISSFATKHKILSGIIIKSIAIFGLLALTVGTLSFAVGTVTKGFLLFELGVKAWRATLLLGKASLELLNLMLIDTKAFAMSAALGIKTMTASLIQTLGPLAAIYAAYKGLTELNDLNNSSKQNNPLGFDYSGTYADNKDKADKAGVSEDQFNKQKKYYFYKRGLQIKGGFYGGFAHDINTGLGMHDSYGIDSTSKPKNPYTAPAIDSTNIYNQQKINQEMQSDSTFNHQFTFVIQDETKNGAVMTNSGKSASAVNVKVLRTFAGYNKTANV